MVEYSYQLDQVFMALSDSTRRKILRQVSDLEMSIGEIAEQYKLTFAAISKHIKVLEKSGLIIKRRQGKSQMVSVAPEMLALARRDLESYETMWKTRFDRLEQAILE